MYPTLLFYIIPRLSPHFETLCLPVLGDAHTRVLVLRAPTAASAARRPAAPPPPPSFSLPHIHMLPSAAAADGDDDARSYVSALRPRKFM